MKCKIISLLALESYQKILKLYKNVTSQLGEYLSCFELMDEMSIQSVVDNLNMPLPLTKPYPFYVLFELSSNDEIYIENRLLEFFDSQQSSSIIENATYTLDSDVKKYSKLKSYRESITEGLKKDGYTYKYDISIPLDVYYETVEVMRNKLKSSNCIRICGYGHIGDSNLHFNVTSNQFDQNILNQIEPFLYEFVAKHNGSISAEHGIGLKKRSSLKYSKSIEAIKTMRQIKQLFDPKCILNPNKIF